MNQEIKTLWVQALRSGEYKQARDWLKTDEGFCCLGVLCELAVKANIIKPAEKIHLSEDYNPWAYDWETRMTPVKVDRWAGKIDGAYIAGGYSVAELNDQGASFDEIADLIEANL